MAPAPLHQRIRWGNVARLLGALGAVALLLAWPHLDGGAPPAVPAGRAVPLTARPAPASRADARPLADRKERADASSARGRTRPVRAAARRPSKRGPSRSQRRPSRPSRPRTRQPGGTDGADEQPATAPAPAAPSPSAPVPAAAPAPAQSRGPAADAQPAPARTPADTAAAEFGVGG